VVRVVSRRKIKNEAGDKSDGEKKPPKDHLYRIRYFTRVFLFVVSGVGFFRCWFFIFFGKLNNRKTFERREKKTEPTTVQKKQKLGKHAAARTTFAPGTVRFV